MATISLHARTDYFQNQNLSYRTGLVGNIYKMLYEEESKGLDGPRRYLQGGPCDVTCTSLSSKRLPKYPPTNKINLTSKSNLKLTANVALYIYTMVY